MFSKDINPVNRAHPGIRQVILIPGLFEPRFALAGLRYSLAKHCGQVEYWRDRLAFRSVETSISRLGEVIAGDPFQSGSIALVTHSFGDWIARASIARASNHRVGALVSLAPVMRAGFLPGLLYGMTGNLVPEIEVIMDQAKASADLDCDDRIRRLVIWSRFDESVRRVPLDHIHNLEVQRVIATHFSIAWQPHVVRLVNEFVFRVT